MERSLIDLGTQPLGHTLESAELDADRIDYLFDALGIAELPVVLDVFPRFDDVQGRSSALSRGHAGLLADNLFADGRIHHDLEAWLRILEQPRWYISGRVVQRPFVIESPINRICLAGNDIGTVLATRSGETMTLTAVTGTPERLVLRALGTGRPFDFRGVSAPTDRLSEALDASPADSDATAKRLAHIGIDADSSAELAKAMSTCSAHAEITSVTVTEGNRTAGPHPVAFFDTHRGRIVATSSTAADGVRWSTLSPGTDARLGSALAELIERANG